MNQWETFIVYACLTNILFSFVHMSCQWQKKKIISPQKNAVKKQNQTYNIQLLPLNSRSFVIFPSWHCEKKRKKERKKKTNILNETKRKLKISICCSQLMHLFFFSFFSATTSKWQTFLLLNLNLMEERLYWFDTLSSVNTVYV